MTKQTTRTFWGLLIAFALSGAYVIAVKCGPPAGQQDQSPAAFGH